MEEQRLRQWLRNATLQVSLERADLIQQSMREEHISSALADRMTTYRTLQDIIAGRNVDTEYRNHKHNLKVIREAVLQGNNLQEGSFTIRPDIIFHRPTDINDEFEDNVFVLELKRYRHRKRAYLWALRKLWALTDPNAQVDFHFGYRYGVCLAFGQDNTGFGTWSCVIIDDLRSISVLDNNASNSFRRAIAEFEQERGIENHTNLEDFLSHE